MLHNYLRQALPPGLTQSPCHPDAEGVADKTQATQQCLRHIFAFAKEMDYQQAKGRFDADANSTQNTGTLLLLLAYMYSLYEGGFCLPAVQVTLAEVFMTRAPLPDVRTHFDEVLQKLQTLLLVSSTDQERAVALNELIYDQNVMARPRDSTEDGAQALAQLYAMKTKAEVDAFVDQKMEARHNHHPVLGPIKNIVQSVGSLRPHVVSYAKQLGVHGVARTVVAGLGGGSLTYAGAAAAGWSMAWPVVVGGAAAAFVSGAMSVADRALYRAQIRQTKGCEGWLAGTGVGSVLDHEAVHAAREGIVTVASVAGGIWAMEKVPKFVSDYSPINPLEPLDQIEREAKLEPDLELLGLTREEVLTADLEKLSQTNQAKIEQNTELSQADQDEALKKVVGAYQRLEETAKQDAYDTLGLDRGTKDEKVIREARRELRSKYHPDKQGQEATQEQKDFAAKKYIKATRASNLLLGEDK